MSDGIDRFEIDLPIDGYDVTVTVNVGSIERAIERQEQRRREEINRKGAGAFDLSKYATVGAEPTMEKWDELAADDRDADEESGFLCL